MLPSLCDSRQIRLRLIPLGVCGALVLWYLRHSITFNGQCSRQKCENVANAEAKTNSSSSMFLTVSEHCSREWDPNIDPKNWTCCRGGPNGVQDPDKRLELLHITKTGGTTLEILAAAHNISWGACHFLSRVDDMPQGLHCPEPQLDSFDSGLPGIPLWHAPPRYLDEKHKRFLQNTSLFTVVRNPYTRVVSCWNYNQGGDRGRNARAMNQYLSKMMTEIYNSRPMNGTGSWRHGYFQGGILIPQMDYIKDDVHVLHMETLERDFTCMMQRRGIHWKWPDKRRNRRGGAGRLTVANLTIANQLLIEKLYHEDFDKLGYRKGSHEL